MVDATEVIRSGAEFLGEVVETAAKGACRLAGGAWEMGAYRVAVAVVEASVAAAAAGVKKFVTVMVDSGPETVPFFHHVTQVSGSK